MSNSICVEKSKPSAVKRISLLPRIGFTIDIAGHSVSYRQAPLLETFANLWDRGFTMKNFMDVSFAQLKEINFPQIAPFPMKAATAGKATPTSKSAPKAKLTTKKKSAKMLK